MNAPAGGHDQRDQREPREAREHRRLPNRRADYPESEYEPPRRRWSDLGPWERMLRSAQTVVPLVVVLNTVWLAIGFKTVKPSDQFESVEGEIRELRARRDSDHAEFVVLLNRTNALARYRCLHLDAETAYQLGLDCNVLLPGYHMQQHPTPDPTEDGTGSSRNGSTRATSRADSVTIGAAPQLPRPGAPVIPRAVLGFLAAPYVRLPQHAAEWPE